MNKTETRVELRTSRRIQDFEPLFDPLTPVLGARFPRSMANWCGIGERPYPLGFWRVFLIDVDGQLAGVTGLYRQFDTELRVCWVGWFGLIENYRGRGIAVTALEELKNSAKSAGFHELRVYTDEENFAAVQAYKRAGFAAQRVVKSRGSTRSAAHSGTFRP